MPGPVLFPFLTAPTVAAPSFSAFDATGITTGGVAQALFGGAIPQSGFSVANLSTSDLWVSQTFTAAPNGLESIQILPGATYGTPAWRLPVGPVTVWGSTTGQAFRANAW